MSGRRTDLDGWHPADDYDNAPTDPHHGGKIWKDRYVRAHEQRDKEMMFLVGRITELVTALENIVDESPADTPYSWCQTKLARCNEIARSALTPTDQQ